jgi:hypothetical protein
VAKRSATALFYLEERLSSMQKTAKIISSNRQAIWLARQGFVQLSDEQLTKLEQHLEGVLAELNAVAFPKQEVRP